MLPVKSYLCKIGTIGIDRFKLAKCSGKMTRILSKMTQILRTTTEICLNLTSGILHGIHQKCEILVRY